jgi:predicted AlkP superfamily pyrophosphatase or phosphodiesterase
MSATRSRSAFRMASFLVLIALVSMLLSGLVPAAARPAGPSTFDVYAPFLSNTVGAAAATSRFEFKVRAIDPDLFPVSVSARSDSALFVPELDRRTVLITKVRPEVTMLLRVNSSGAPQGTEGWVTVSATRGSETHKLNFLVTVLDAGPKLELGSADGAKEQDIRLSDGAPFEVALKATNRGASTSTFPLSHSAPPGWRVMFKTGAGDPIESLEVAGLLPYLEFARATTLKAVIDPPDAFPESPATEVTVGLGDSRLVIRVARKGMLYSPNDMGGIYPHVHQVRPGGKTSYRLYVTNATGSRAPFNLRVSGVPAGWSASLSRRLASVAAGGTEVVDLDVGAPGGAAAGLAATVTVEARGGGASDTVALAARTSTTPKVYYFSIDSMSYSYLTYNSVGTAPGREGDWLMPNIHNFMKDSVAYSDASALMPAATDMNHTSALSGCYPGTEGIYCVSMSFNGTTERGRMITQPTSLDHARTLQDGTPVKVQRIYELAKQANPEALCAFLSNKSWLVGLESDPATQSAVERSVSSESRPVYMPPVEKYVLGDPPTDNDPLLDPMQKSMLVTGASHMITEKLPPQLCPQPEALARPLLNLFGANLFPDMNELTRWLIMPANIGVGSNPQGFCSDSYMGDSLMSLLNEEDPDVTYCNLGELDETGHLIGSAEDPSEWNTRGTAAARDDESSISGYALRDDAIDVCRQADTIFGDFINTLKKRGVYDSSIVVMLADHGMHNYKRPEKGYEVLDNRGLLRKNGFVMGTDYDYDVGAMDYDLVYSRDKKNLPAIERVLEEYTVKDPVAGNLHPMVVFNREEMKSGKDVNSGISVNPGEFYSAYWVGRDSEGADVMKWPDLIVYAMDRYYSRIYADTATKGANAVGVKADVNLPSELSLMATGGHISFNTRHIPLVYKGPGARPGTRVDEKVFLSDIAPTIYGALGWTTPKYVDGKPLPLP